MRLAPRTPSTTIQPTSHHQPQHNSNLHTARLQRIQRPSIPHQPLPLRHRQLHSLQPLAVGPGRQPIRIRPPNLARIQNPNTTANVSSYGLGPPNVPTFLHRKSPFIEGPTHSLTGSVAIEPTRSYTHSLIGSVKTVRFQDQPNTTSARTNTFKASDIPRPGHVITTPQRSAEGIRHAQLFARQTAEKAQHEVHGDVIPFVPFSQKAASTKSIR